MSVAIVLMFVAALALPAVSSADDPPFDLTSFSNRTINADETPYTLAGGHPVLNVTEFSVDGGGRNNEGHLVTKFKGTYVSLPLGFIGNPAAAPRCPFSKITANLCPPGSQVGVVFVNINSVPSTHPLYNLPPEDGYPAQFGFSLESFPTVLSVFPQPRTDSYGLTVGTPNIPTVGVVSFSGTFFGIPSQHGSGTSEAPFLSNPVDCLEAEPTWSIAMDTLQHAGSLLELGAPDLSDPDWLTASEPAPPVTECDNPALTDQFAQTGLGVKPLQGGGAIQADSPTGLAVDLNFPQSNDPTDLSTTFDPEIPQAPEPKDITVTLPAGLSINPSSAGGLGACSDLASDPAGDQVHYDNVKPVSCPDASKIGSVTAISPLLARHDPITDAVNGPEPIPGAVYLLKPHPGDLPIGGGSQAGKFRLLIQLENERYGVNFKLPGVATADPKTGQLSATFTQNPQLPASHITVNLKEGPRAPLATPVTCGGFGATSDIVPWSTPGTPDAHPTASFNVSSGPNGTPCPLSAATRPFAPAMSAGTESNGAGQPSPLDLHLIRQDGEQELSSLEATMPRGLAAKFAGVPYCSEAALATAAGRSGQAEQANPTCPASRIGSVTAGIGPGSNPFYAHGNAYLSGPYKGAPMSVSVITPAVAGPFDLGTAVVRTALFIDPETAQGHVVSDPFPTILDGVPLRLRSIDVNLDRPDFTLNPTNCEPLAVQTTIHSTDGGAVSPSDSFQAGDCNALGFRPSLALSLSSGLARNGHPALRAVLRPGTGEAGIAAASLTLPDGGLLDIQHLRALCARGLPVESCPRASRAGYVRLWSPLLDRPLEGHIYLRTPSHRLPDLLADLRGGGLHVLIHGRTAAARGGRLRISFPALPDVPLTKAVVTLAGGRRGIFVNSEALCARPHRATVSLSAHNGKQRRLRPLLRLRGHC